MPSYLDSLLHLRLWNILELDMVNKKPCEVFRSTGNGLTSCESYSVNHREPLGRWTLCLSGEIPKNDCRSSGDDAEERQMAPAACDRLRSDFALPELSRACNGLDLGRQACQDSPPLLDPTGSLVLRSARVIAI